MNNFIEHVHTFTTQDDADDVFTMPLAADNTPLRFVQAIVYLSAVTGSPTAVTIDLDITGTTTNTLVAAVSIGAAAGQARQTPDSLTDGTADIPADAATAGDDNWRYKVDFNFTRGTTPAVTGALGCASTVGVAPYVYPRQTVHWSRVLSLARFG